MNPLSAAPRRTVRHPAAATALCTCVLLADGNGGKNVPYQAARTAGCRTDVLSEAMLPEIRTVAMLLAAERHPFAGHSPHRFADEADWFAARIIVLAARTFYLDTAAFPMMQRANRRAQAFAEKHGLPFQAACIRIVRERLPDNLIAMDCALPNKTAGSLKENTLAVRRLLNLPFQAA